LIRFVEQTGSTNRDLADAVARGQIWPEGDWLVARRQSAGRGRQGRQWFDGEGNFAGSTLVEPRPGDPPAPSLAAMTSLALARTVQSYLPDPDALMLKWPNDVLLDGAKLAGILLERVGEYVVVGIGVNLRVAPQLPDRATIALAAKGDAPDVESFAEQLAQSFAEELARWRREGMGVMFERWLALAHPKGTRLAVHESDGMRCEGVFDGLDAQGRLRLRLANGRLRVIHAGDVTIDQRKGLCC